jgi:D-xylose transport system substrate-binding protein
MSYPSVLKRLVMVGCALLAVGLLVAGCGGGDDGGGGPKIALLLPENETPRYESDDRPDFEDAVEEKCQDCEVLYNNAGGDASKQQSQAEAALTQGAEVLVVDPMDSKSAAAIVEKAKAQDVPVVSYDRLIENAEVDAYVSYVNEEVGELQGETLAKKMEEDGNRSVPIIMINGDPADPNAAQFKKGAHKALKSNSIEIAKEYDTPGWSAENAQREAQQAITALGKFGFGGIYAANDDTAGGAIAAMKGAGVDPATRPVTGQDATVAGLQRILAGEQFMTVYKKIEPEATISAEIAIALAEGKGVPQNKITDEVNNGKIDVPSVLLKPIAVTKDNVKETVVADEFVTADELCTGPYKSACDEAGISG